MKYQINKSVVTSLRVPLLVLGSLLVFVFSPLYTPSEIAAIEIQSSLDNNNEELFKIDESIFPDNYPDFLKQAYLLFQQIIVLEKVSPETQENFLKNQTEELQILFRDILANNKVNLKQLCSLARMKSGQKEFEKFLNRFGISQGNSGDIELEVLAQIDRMRSRGSIYRFTKEFDNPNNNLSKKVELVESSTKPVELEYALVNCKDDEYEALREVIVSKKNFGPQTKQDRELFDYLESNRLRALRTGDNSAKIKWQKVISQLISQQVGDDNSRLPFSKWELFAMMRNAERTLEQRKQPFIDITEMELLNKEAVAYAREIIKKAGINTESNHDQEIIKKAGINTESNHDQEIIAYGFTDDEVVAELNKLKQIYEVILNNNESGQCEETKRSIQLKKELLELIEISPGKNLKMHHQMSNDSLQELVKYALKDSNALYRQPFIRGIILLKNDDGTLAYRFIEDFPMIVAGETYPYQWKHDNEVNIALLLANLDPYTAAQAVRLGLYISRRLARLMGGDIIFKSNEKDGSSFTLTIPFYSYAIKPDESMTKRPDSSGQNTAEY